MLGFLKVLVDVGNVIRAVHALVSTFDIIRNWKKEK